MSVAILPSVVVREHETITTQQIAVLIPCLNEEVTVGTVIKDFQRELPNAAIWVVDNGSTDSTIAVAIGAGARVLREPRQGKGFALRAAFRDIEADVYVLADGDNQLPADAVHALVKPVLDGKADMVVGSRAMGRKTSPNPINNLGNIIFSKILRSALAVEVTDVLSGYRALSRLLVKSLPLSSRNFEIEVELTIKTSQRSYRIREIPYEVRPRPEASASHLRVVRDGARISWAILLLFRDYRPMAFFGIAGVLWLVLAGVLFWLSAGVGKVLFMSVDVIAMLVAIFGLLSITIGTILSVLSRRFQEIEGKVDMVTTIGLARGPEDR